MKKLAICLMLALCICAGALAEPVSREGVCMQVIGETDLPADQQYKLLVRNWALEYVHANIDPASDPYAQLALLADSIEAHLNARAMESGRQPIISVDVGAFRYPEKECGDAAYPAGIYRALRITIGTGAGRNWWCMLYPGDYENEDTVYYSAIVNWLLELLGVN